MLQPTVLTDAQARMFIRLALVAAGASVVFSLIAMAANLIVVNPWTVALTIAVVLLAYGIYRGSFLCAAGLCVLQGANLLYIALATHRAPATAGLAFFVAYLGGAAGTAALPKPRNPRTASSASPVP